MNPTQLRDRMIDRFEENYIPEPMSGCHLWLGSVRRTHGYTVARFFNSERKRYEAAPRFAWELARGEIPDGMLVLHKCDNSLCVSTNHLYLGNHQRNMMDREERRRGRHQRDPNGVLEHMRNIRKLAQHDGEKHSQAKLTWDDVRAIRASDLSNVELAVKYGVDKVHIWNIRAGKYWKEPAA